MQFLNSRAQIIIIIDSSSGALSCRLTTIFLALVVLLLVAIVLRLEDKLCVVLENRIIMAFSV
jgi:hypothetical protein